jgi:hypothetical protein
VAIANPILGGSKHISGAYNPDDQRIYFTGGDHSGGAFTQNTDLFSSYRQETYSLSLTDALADSKNPVAGFRLEYPYCGPVGQVQPKHPDYTGWTYDSKRKVFWLVPGQAVTAESNCDGETQNISDDPGFLWANHLMQFDPVTKKWTDAGVGIGPIDNWQAHYDAVNDELLDFIYDGGQGALARIYNIQQRSWRMVHMATPAANDTIRFHKGVSATDPEKRVIYAMDNLACHLYAFDIATETASYLADCPVPGDVASESQAKVVWDPAHQVLIYGYTTDAPPYSGYYAFHPDTKAWEKLPNTTPEGQIIPNDSGMVFDPVTQAIVSFGVGNRNPPITNSSGQIFAFLYGGPTVSPVTAMR